MNNFRLRGTNHDLNQWCPTFLIHDPYNYYFDDTASLSTNIKSVQNIYIPNGLNDLYKHFIHINN